MTLDEWNKLPPVIKANLARMGVSPGSTDVYKGRLPSTAAGAYKGTPVLDMRNMDDNTQGVTTSAKDGRTNAIVRNAEDKDQSTVGHEFDHVLAAQGLGHPTRINDKFDELRAQDYKGKPNATDQAEADRMKLVAALVKNAPYLAKNWGLQPADATTGYFSPSMMQFQGNLAPNLFAEQAATLSALEQAKNKSLTDDPYMRANVFTDQGLRETYNALTGLRQTRLDAKDLPPYTRQPEASPPQDAASAGWLDKLKQLLGK